MTDENDEAGDFEDDDLDSSLVDVEDETEDDEQPSAPVYEGPPDPVPVAVTSAIYSNFRTEFGEDQAFVLQSKWGDSALAKDQIVAAMLEDAPAIGTIYEAHQTEQGGLSLEGAQAAYQHFLDASDYDTSEALNQAHPELTALYHDYADESGALSPAGVKIILAYLAEKTGYKHAYHAKR